MTQRTNQQLLQDAYHLQESGRLAEAEAAHSRMESGHHIGKIVLHVGEGSAPVAAGASGGDI